MNAGRGLALRLAPAAIAALTVVLWRPVAEHVRAASLLERFGDPSANTAPSPDVTEELFPIARASGAPIRARLYVPRGTSRGAVVLVPGVHHLGVDEP